MRVTEKNTKKCHKTGNTRKRERLERLIEAHQLWKKAKLREMIYKCRRGVFWKA